MSAQPATVPQLPRVRDQRPARRRLRRSTRGWAYAWPTALFVLLLFVLPLGLVLRMSASKWPLLSGDQGINFPDNYRKAVSNRFFAESITFTLKYTLLATMLLIALGLGDRPEVPRTRKGQLAPDAERVQTLFGLAAGPGIFGMHIYTEGAAIDLRSAEPHQFQQRWLKAGGFRHVEFHVQHCFVGGWSRLVGI